MRYPGDHHVYHFLAPESGHPRWEENSTEKIPNARSFFLSHTSKLNQQCFKSTAKIYPSNNYNIFPSFIIDQSWNTLQLKILCLASTHLLSQSLPFLQLQVCDLISHIKFLSWKCRLLMTSAEYIQKLLGLDYGSKEYEPWSVWSSGQSDLGPSVLQIRVRTGKLIFLISQPKHMLWVRKEPFEWDGSFGHPQHMFRLMGKEIHTILGS